MLGGTGQYCCDEGRARQLQIAKKMRGQPVEVHNEDSLKISQEQFEANEQKHAKRLELVQWIHQCQHSNLKYKEDQRQQTRQKDRIPPAQGIIFIHQRLGLCCWQIMSNQKVDQYFQVGLLWIWPFEEIRGAGQKLKSG